MPFETITLSSAGALSVVVLCLVFALFQGLVAYRRPDFIWNRWGAILSLLTALYSLVVFFQFSLSIGPGTRVCEKIQLSAFPLILCAIHRFTDVFLDRHRPWEYRLLLPLSGLYLILIWFTDLILARTFVSRSFLWNPRPYIEPELGPLGIVFLGLLVVQAVVIVFIWWPAARRKVVGAQALVVCFFVWLLLGIHDILATLGMPTIQFLMPFGFFGFSVAVISITIHRYIRLMQLVEDNERALQKAKEGLEERVTERTAAIARSNRELMAEIREREQVEHALRESEEKFRSLIANISDVIAILDPACIIGYVSPSIRRHFGWRPETLLETDSLDLVHPEDRLRVRCKLNHLLRKPQASCTVCCRFQARDRLYRHIELMAVNMFDNQRIAGILVNFRDISDRIASERALKASEQRLRKAQAMAHVGHWEYDPATQTVRGSEEWFRLYGIEQTSAVVALETVRALVVAEDRQRVHQALEALVNQNAAYDLAFRIRRANDSQLVWLHTKGELIFKGEGHAPRVSGVIQDITAAKRSEEEKNQLENQLRQAQKMESIGTLAGGIAHDFNNILSPIIGFTEMTAAELPPDSQARANLQEVLTAAHRAKEMVRHILTFSRQDTQEMKAMKLQPVVRESMKLLRSSLPSTIVIQECFDRESGSVIGDSTQIHQLVVNLCTNAYQAMRERGGRLTVSLTEIGFDAAAKPPCADMVPGDTYVCLSVADTGHGIDEAIRDRIFEPYFTTKGPAEGTGMGLSMVHGIVKRHQGRITVESVRGRGTVFRVYIPQMISVQETRRDETSEVVPVGCERILLVDDEPQLLSMQRQILERLGYAVAAVNSSREALKLFRQAPADFDLLVTDQTMPAMTGAELSVAVLAIRPDLPIVLCTGFSEALSPEAAADLGIRHYLQKPVPLKPLAQTVRLALDEAREHGAAGFSTSEAAAL